MPSESKLRFLPLAISDIIISTGTRYAKGDQASLGRAFAEINRAYLTPGLATLIIQVPVPPFDLSCHSNFSLVSLFSRMSLSFFSHFSRFSHISLPFLSPLSSLASHSSLSSLSFSHMCLLVHVANCSSQGLCSTVLRPLSLGYLIRTIEVRNSCAFPFAFSLFWALLGSSSLLFFAHVGACSLGRPSARARQALARRSVRRYVIQKHPSFYPCSWVYLMTCIFSGAGATVSLDLDRRSTYVHLNRPRIGSQLASI